MVKPRRGRDPTPPHPNPHPRDDTSERWGWFFYRNKPNFTFNDNQENPGNTLIHSFYSTFCYWWFRCWYMAYKCSLLASDKLNKSNLSFCYKQISIRVSANTRTRVQLGPENTITQLVLVFSSMRQVPSSSSKSFNVWGWRREMDQPDWFCLLFGAEVTRSNESEGTNASVTWCRCKPRPLTCQTHLTPWPAPCCSPRTRLSCSQNTRGGRSPAAGPAEWRGWCCRACRSCDSPRCTSGNLYVWCSDTAAGCWGPSTGRTAARAQSGPHRDRSTAVWPDDPAGRRPGPQPLQTEQVFHV